MSCQDEGVVSLLNMLLEFMMHFFTLSDEVVSFLSLNGMTGHCVLRRDLMNERLQVWRFERMTS